LKLAIFYGSIKNSNMGKFYIKPLTKFYSFNKLKKMKGDEEKSSYFGCLQRVPVGEREQWKI